MKLVNYKMRINITIQECANIKSATNRMKKIQQIYRLVKKHENMIDCTFENYTDIMYKVELLEGCQPYHAKLFFIPKENGKSFTTKVSGLLNIVVLIIILNG